MDKTKKPDHAVDYEPSIAELRKSFWKGSTLYLEAGSKPKLLQANEAVLPNPPKEIKVTLEVATNAAGSRSGLTDLTAWFGLFGYDSVRRAPRYVMPPDFDGRAPLSPEAQLYLFGPRDISVGVMAQRKLGKLQYDAWMNEARDRAARVRAMHMKALKCLSCGRDDLGGPCSCGA